jgi:PKD repeat protein
MLATVFVVAVNSGVDGGPVILNPGYIQGTVTVIGEEPSGGNIYATSIPYGYDSSVGIYSGNYDLTVEGYHDYKVIARPAWLVQSLGYWSLTNLYMEPQYTYVNIGETVDLDYTLDPGHVQLSVNVIGGDIRHIYWNIYSSSDPLHGIRYHTKQEEGGVNVWDPVLQQYIFYPLSGTTTVPVVPWESIDANNDGYYEKYLYAVGHVTVGAITYALPKQYISVAVGETVYVQWDLDVTPGIITGSVNMVDEEFRDYGLVGSAMIGETPVVMYPNIRPAGVDYYFEMPATTWELYPQVRWWGASYPRQGYLTFASIADTLEIGPGEHIIHNWNINPSYAQGAINLWGANTEFEWARIDSRCQETSPSGANSYSTFRSYIDNYEVVLHEGNWGIGSLFQLYFDYNPNVEGDYEVSTMGIYNAHVMRENLLTTVAAGETVTDVDFDIGTAMITLNYEVEGGGLLWAPRIYTFSREEFLPYRVDTHCYGYGSADPTTLGECTVTVPAGYHRVQAHAYVEDGSFAKFGEFYIDVEAGDVIIHDIGAPILDVTHPLGYQHVITNNVLVEGTATDDSEIATITVNGVEVQFTSTNNPDDPNEVSFSTTVEGLVFGENTITVVATDTYDKTTTVERIVISDYQNGPPVAAIDGPYFADEGEEIPLDASSSSDPDEGDVLQFRWDCDGDGVWDTEYLPSPTIMHSWEDEFSGDVIVEVSDGQETDTASASITVSNAAPVLGTITASTEPIEINTEISILCSFTDAGTSDIHTAIIDWGDEITTDGLVTEEDGSGIVTGTHPYTSPGVHTITLTVSDEDGGSATTTFQYIVVYDPTSGFVTGGGWINSPESAYYPDTTLSGKANFGFVSKYKKGTTIPTGKTEFQFHAADMNFHSDSYEWLVVANSKAMFKGTGTINGIGEYKFILTGIDGDLQVGGGEDKFRIRIWTENEETGIETVIYDNLLGAADDAELDDTTVIGGGNIKIHKG